MKGSDDSNDQTKEAKGGDEIAAIMRKAVTRATNEQSR